MSDDLVMLRESEIDAMIADAVETANSNTGAAILEVAKAEAKVNAIRQYIGECNALGDEPELDTLIELVGGVDE
jgi:hypothetical protein